MRNNKFRFYEIILLILIWILLIASPFFFIEKENIEWRDVSGPLRPIIPLIFIFLINRFILVPKLLFKKKSIYYIISVVAMISVFSFGLYLFTNNPKQIQPHQQTNRPWQPPPHSPNLGDRPPPPVENIPGGRPIPPFANLLVFSLLLVGFDTGLMSTFKLAKSERKRAKLEKENAETQLAFLRNQVSPHFFMNTLNNIHSLIDHDSDEAKESIIRLSKLMRHLLYDSEIEMIPVQKEIDFIKNYVDLMKLRYSDRVKIKLSIPAKLPDKSIPPLLFTSYVENAFKHGISYQNSSFIDIKFTIDNNNLIFKVHNSKPHQEINEEPSGIGIENSQKRLDLIYGDNYTLEIDDEKDEYHVLLSIPI